MNKIETLLQVLNKEIESVEAFLESEECDDNQYYRINDKWLPALKMVRDGFTNRNSFRLTK